MYINPRGNGNWTLNSENEAKYCISDSCWPGLIGANTIEERTLTGTAGRWPRDFTNWLFNRGSTVVGLSDMIISEATVTYSFKSCTNTFIRVDLEYTPCSITSGSVCGKMPRCFTELETDTTKKQFNSVFHSTTS